ncbi:MAG: FkbM family methyltransferase [Bacteroidetes bacterium]|nr:FkbM family methyltransferase [Bacteroidota bacterium]
MGKPSIFLYWLIYKTCIRLNALIGFNSAQIPRSLLNDILRGRPDSVVIDVGCNKGEFTKAVFDVNPSTKVIAFDLHKDLSKILNSKFSDKNFTFENIALSDFSGRASIMRNSNNDRKAYLSKFMSKNTDDSVQVTTLDIFTKSFTNKSIQILKIDTEGNDYKVLVGAKKTLKKVDLIIFEIMYKTLETGIYPNDFIKYLKSFNFCYFYRSTKFFGLIPITSIAPFEIQTQNIVASKVDLKTLNIL